MKCSQCGRGCFSPTRGLCWPCYQVSAPFGEWVWSVAVAALILGACAAAAWPALTWLVRK